MPKEDEILNELKKIRLLLETKPATTPDAPQPSDGKTIKYDILKAVFLFSELLQPYAVY
jgi:hypothetical protein